MPNTLLIFEENFQKHLKRVLNKCYRQKNRFEISDWEKKEYFLKIFTKVYYSLF